MNLSLTTLTQGNVVSPISGTFSLILSGAAGGTNWTSGTGFSASANPANSNYIFKQLGDNPNNSKTAWNAFGGTPGYTYMNFKTLQDNIIANTVTKAVTNKAVAKEIFFNFPSLVVASKQ